MRRPETRNRPWVLANILSKYQNFYFFGIKSEIYQTSLEHIFQKILFSFCRAFKTTLQPRRRRTALSVSCPGLVFVRKRTRHSYPDFHCPCPPTSATDQFDRRTRTMHLEKPFSIMTVTFSPTHNSVYHGFYCLVRFNAVYHGQPQLITVYRGPRLLQNGLPLF